MYVRSRLGTALYLGPSGQVSFYQAVDISADAASAEFGIMMIDALYRYYDEATSSGQPENPALRAPGLQSKARGATDAALRELLSHALLVPENALLVREVYRFLDLFDSPVLLTDAEGAVIFCNAVAGGLGWANWWPCEQVSRCTFPSDEGDGKTLPRAKPSEGPGIFSPAIPDVDQHQRSAESVGLAALTAACVIQP